MWKIKNRTASILGLAAAATIALPAIAVASYQGSQPATTPTGASAPQQAAATATPGPKGRWGRHDGAGLDAIAQQLGVTTDVLKTAMQKARTDVGTPAAGADPQTVRTDFIAALAKELGLDQATVGAAVGNLPLGRFDHGDRRGPGPNGAGLDAIAQQLGVTTDVLKTAMQKARTDVGTPAAGADPQTVRTDFIAALAKELGLDQATVDAAVGSTPFGLGGPHAGGREFRGHGGRGGRGAPNSTPAPAGSGV